MTDHAVSHVVNRIICRARAQGGEISIGDCTDLLGSRSLLLAILVLALVNSLPIPGIPGFSTVTGLPIMLLAWQLMRGRKSLWLPRRMTAHKLHSQKLFHGLEKALPWLREGEKRMKRRFQALCQPPLNKLPGAAIFILAFLLALPVPFMNFPMGISITVITLGLLARDGLVTAAGLVMAALAIAFLPLLLLNGAEMIAS